MLIRNDFVPILNSSIYVTRLLLDSIFLDCLMVHSVKSNNYVLHLLRFVTTNYTFKTICLKTQIQFHRIVWLNNLFSFPVPNNVASNNVAGTDSAAATAGGAKKYKMVLFDKAEWQFSEREKEAIEVILFDLMILSCYCFNVDYLHAWFLEAAYNVCNDWSNTSY